MLEHYFENHGPGAALGVATPGRDPEIECRGLASVEDARPITPDTPFDLASVSKWFTAAAVMRLVESRDLDLHAPVPEYLPLAVASGPSRPITVRDLLWHTSGLADYLEAGIATPEPETTARHVMERLPEWASSAWPGREHRYSNTNYFVLARIVETITGSTFGEFVDATLVRPYGLRATTASATARRTLAMAKGYQNLGYGLPSFHPIEDVELDTCGDGGVASSLNDLLRWQSLFWGLEVVSERSVRLMRTPGTLDSGEAFPYGMGLQIEESGAEAWCGHGGSWTSATTLVGRFSSGEVIVIVLSNEIVAPVERISQRAFDMRCARSG